MRGRMIIIAAFLLAACGEPIEPAAPDRAEPAVAPPPVAAAPAAAAVPAPFLGTYDVSREACLRSGDGRLTVTASELRFHESIGTVRKVTGSGSSVSVEADYQGEGESWRSVRELRLGDGGATLTVSGDGTSLERMRCPGGTR